MASDLNRETIAVVSDLLTGLRHELGNLVTVLNLDVDVLDGHLPTDENEHGGLAELRYNLGDLNRLLARLRAYPQPGATHIPFDLNQMALETISQVHQVNSISIHYSASAVPLWIDGDQTGILRALSAILENAIEAAPPGQPHANLIEFSIQAQNALAVITIADRGRGFSEQELETGAPFWPGYTTKIKDGFLRGLGLGLFMAQAIVELHDGTIQLQNRSEGGAAVTIRLPRLPEPLYAETRLEHET